MCSKHDLKYYTKSTHRTDKLKKIFEVMDRKKKITVNSLKKFPQTKIVDHKSIYNSKEGQSSGVTELFILVQLARLKARGIPSGAGKT